MSTIEENTVESNIARVPISPYLDLASEYRIDEYVSDQMDLKARRLASYEGQVKANGWVGILVDQQRKEFTDDFNSARVLCDMLNEHSIDLEYPGESVDGKLISDWTFCRGCSIGRYGSGMNVRFRDCKVRLLFKKRLGLL